MKKKFFLKLEMYNESKIQYISEYFNKIKLMLKK